MIAYVLTYMIVTSVPGQPPRIQRFEHHALTSVESCLEVARGVQRSLRRGERLSNPVCERKGWMT